MKLLMSIVLLVLCTCASAQGFNGTFKANHDGSAYTLVLTAADGKLSGTLAEGGVKMKVQGTYSGSRGNATATVEGLPVKMFLQLTRTSNKLIVVVMEEGENGKADPDSKETITFDAPDEKDPAPDPSPKPKPANPTPTPKPADTKPTEAPAAKPAGKPGEKPTLENTPWKVLKHPIGLSVRIPQEWRVEDKEEAYQLFPPGVDAQSREVYLMVGQSAEGVREINDPRVAQTVDAGMAQIAPLLKRVGGGEPIAVGPAKGVLFTYEGGQGAVAKIYCTILKETAIALIGIGEKAKVSSREPVLRSIFRSFAAGEEKRDPAVAGVWNRLGTTGLDARDNVGRLQASSVTDSQRTIVLQPDGTAISRSSSRTIAIGQGVSIDTGDNVTTKRGKWVAGDGTLMLIWEKDAEEYDYKINISNGVKQLILKLDKTRAVVYEPGR